MLFLSDVDVEGDAGRKPETGRPAKTFRSWRALPHHWILYSPDLNRLGTF